MTECSAETRHPSKSRLAPPAVPGLCVTFRGVDPSEDVVYFVRRCVARLEDAHPLEVTIEARAGGHRVRIRDHLSGRGLVDHADDVFLAARNAFDRWRLDAGQSNRA